ncbi:macrophage-expressed gene 1 protein-like [Bradysia coprophila]|uniref:macrophage-expressed gene 1 protein-like n=1 Tax=Bradysia coprophila TaxID=38358 RepID=UPI00187D8F48|nr:macrophage-expressed gene 1 protein-like [Bradysia coprophila]XP_037049521.1 macrophage-expressed gene 1 protein-like [Bradysia coprophila]
MKAKWYFVTLFLVGILCRINGISLSSSTSRVDEPKKLCTSTYPKLNSLPGNGWWSLRNIEMNPVFSITYNKCQILETPTGNYLLPDHLHITPKSESDIDTTQELIESYQKFISTTSSSMSASASGGYGKFSAQGTFSSEYKHMKKNQVINKSVTSRICGRYVLHAARFDEYTVELHPDLKVKLLDAIDAIENGHLTKASLILEMTILSHGTHAVTGIDLGGVIVKEDYLSAAYVSNNDMNELGLTASASIGFADFFNMKCSYSKADYTDQYSQYTKNTKSTKISSHGGQLIDSAMLNISTWVESVPSYQTAVDRSGVALPYVITPRHFPHVNQTTLAVLRREFTEAIEHFNAVNIRIGCMNQFSPNFDYNANIGDKSCNAPPTNYSLGGFFQNCHCTGDNNCASLCANRTVTNFLTGEATCPENFTPVFLNEKKFSATREQCWQDCYCFLFCFCDTNCETINIDYGYETYWCAANVYPVPEKSGLMFGGVFTSTAINPVTGSKNCPPNFSEVSILQDLTVCASNDYEFGYKYSIPFGGFFSCRAGNPLASISLSNEKNAKLLLTASKATCGDGYSQHAAAIDNDCLINYCVKANSFGFGQNEIPIQLPPFQNYDEMFAEEETKQLPVVINRSSVVSIVLGTLLGFVVLANVLFVAVKCFLRRRRSRAEDNERKSLLGNTATTSEYESISGDVGDA